MKLGKIIAAAMTVLFFAAPAFAQGVDYDSVDPTGQTVTFWFQHSLDREEAMQKLIKEFNDTNEYGITVVGEYQGNYDDIFQKMVALLGTKDVPNLVVAYQNQAATYALADGVVDMNPLVESEKWGMTQEDIDDFFPGFWTSDIFPSFGNARYGLAPNRSIEVLYVNNDWLKELREAGLIDFDGAPTTPAQFEAAACAASQNPFSGASSTSRSLGYELSIDASRFASWTFAFGSDIYDAEANQYILDSDAAVNAMTWMQGLFEQGCADFVSEPFGDQTNFGAGTTLFTVSSSSGLPFYESAIEAGANFDWTVAAIPHTTPDPVMNVYGASVSMPSGHSPEADVAAWLFLKWSTETHAQAEWAIASQYFPVRRSVAESISVLFDQMPNFEVAFNLLDYGISEPNVPGYDFVRAQLENDMAAIMDGADVADTLAFANEEANLILEDQLSQF